MAMNLTNRSKQLLVVPLNSGAAIHLAPGEETVGIDPIEIKNNATVQKMVQKGWIVLTETKEEAMAHHAHKRGRGR